MSCRYPVGVRNHISIRAVVKLRGLERESEITEASPIPESYDQWRTCITVRCGIPLTRTFVESRLEELRDVAHPRTQAFREKYGAEYLDQIVGWYEMAQQEAS